MHHIRRVSANSLGLFSRSSSAEGLVEVRRRRLPVPNRALSVDSRSMASSDQVIHDVENKEFYINFGEERAKLQYELNGNVYDLYHTFTPPSSRGTGIAKVLAHKAFDYVVESGGKMKLTCSYLDHLNKKEQNPKHASHVIE